MDFQKIVNTAAAAKGVEVAEPEFQAQFKSLSKNVYEIPNILSEQQEELLKFIAPIPYKTSKEKGPVTNDHPVMVALRALIRQDYENNVFSKRISDLSARTLVVGSAAREIFKYNNKQNFDFYFHGSDGKDVERTILPLLEEILSITKSKIKGSKTLRSAFSRDSQEGDGQEIFNFYSNIVSLFDHYQKLSKRGKIIKTTYEGQGVYNYLLFEDSFYNFDSQALYKIFKTTGAKAGFGYMILPQEFFFPKLALNPFYFLTQDGKYTKMGYKEGYCNGYVHETRCWRLLADNMGFSFPEFNLLCEIKSRVGPFITFSISKVHCALNEHRIIHLGKRFYCVHLLNILEHNLGLKNGVTKYSYFPVLAIEFHTAVNYFSAIKPASRTPENLIHMCNATNGDWAYVSLQYFSTNCTLIRYDYADPYEIPVLLFYIYYFIYLFSTFVLFPLFLFIIYLFIKNKTRRFVSNEGDALLTRHPDGYWANQVGDNAPFGNFFRGLMRN